MKNIIGNEHKEKRLCQSIMAPKGSRFSLLKNVKWKTWWALGCFMMFLATAAGQINVEVVQHESCSGNDGIARVNIPEPQQDYLITWSNGSHQSVIEKLTQGTYAVKVCHALCPDKPIFEDYVIIVKDEGNLKVTISAVTDKEATCNEPPVVQLTARASNGMAPLTYEWKNKTVSMGGYYTCTVTDARGCKATGQLPLFIKPLDCDNENNQLRGADGYGDSRMIALADELAYTISFNYADQQPAVRVQITYPIPPELNINTLYLSDFSLSGTLYTIPAGTRNYHQRIDMRGTTGLWVDVDASIDMTSRQLTWTMQGIDPATGAAPANLQTGFLPDNGGHGEGTVGFVVASNGDLHSGDTLKAQAWIAFDENSATATNIWTNLYDAEAPQSRCDTLRTDRALQYCELTVSAQDEAKGSGIKEVEIFVSENDAPYQSIGICMPGSTLRYDYHNGSVYRFVSSATDHVGNKEKFHSQPDIILNLNEAPLALTLSPANFDETAELNTIVGIFSTVDNNMDDTFTYQLVSGEDDEDNARFIIEGDQLLTNANFNCDGREYYNIRVRTTDKGQLFLEKSFEISKNLINPSYMTRIAKELCQGDSYTFGNKTLTEGGIYYDTLQTVMGCDSIVELTLYENPSYHLVEQLVKCDNELPFTYAGRYFDENTQSGTYDIPFVLTTGCDSLVTLNLTIHKTYKDIIDKTSICQGPYPFSYKQFKDIDISQAGEKVITTTFTTVDGCDSTVTLYLTVNPSYEKAEQRVICSQDLPYKYDETHIFDKGTVSGIYPIVYTLPTGCDSVIMLSLTVNPTYEDVRDTVEVCQSSTPFSYKKFENLNISTAGTQTIQHTFKTVHQCDSIVHLTLIVNPTYNLTDYAETCRSQELFNYKKFKNIDVSTVGTKMIKDVFQSKNGCDSVVSLILTIHPDYNNIFDTVTTCQSDEPFNYKHFKNIDVNTAGTKQVTETFSSHYGCDSTVTLTLFIKPSFQEIIEDDICEGEAYDKNGFSVPADKVVPPLYTQKRTYPAANGCDSSYVLRLTVHPKYDITLNDTVCRGKPYSKHGFSVSASETGVVGSLTYRHSQNSAAGCDSVTTLILQVEPDYHPIIQDEICEGEAYTKNGFNIPAEEVLPPMITRELHLQTACHCDSIVELQLTVHPAYHKNLYDAVCQGEAYSKNGFDIPAEEVLPPYLTREHTLTTEKGCDSTVILNLTVYPIYDNITDRTAACQSTKPFSYKQFRNLDISEAGDFLVTDTFKTVRGCDSIVTLSLKVYPSYYIEETITTCQSDKPFSYLGFDNLDISMPGTRTYKHYFKTQSACDSNITLHVTVYPSYTRIYEDTICEGEPYNKHGLFIPAEEVVPPMVTRRITNETANGCDSSITLFLVVNPSYYGITDETSTCQSNIPFDYKGFKSLNVSKPGIYTIERTFDTRQGCDSVVTLTLEVFPSHTVNITDVVCQGEPYRENGFNISAEDNQILGTYYYELHLQTIHGCDSTINLTLKVKQPLGSIGNIAGNTLIAEAGAYTYSIAPVSNAISYRWEISNSNWTLSASNSTSVRLYIPTPGNGILTVTAMNDCKEVTSTLNIQSSIDINSFDEEKRILIYPNPTRDRVEVQISDFDKRNCQNNCYVNIYDMYGKWLASQQITGETTIVDLSTFAGGLYLLRISNGTNIIGTFKIVKNE